MAKAQVPFFLSSATNYGANSSNTRFDVNLQPPLEIPNKATAARAFIHSATIPYTFPNVVAGKNTLRVQVPKDSNNDGTMDTVHDMTITIPPGIYTLNAGKTDASDGDSGLETAINNAVEDRLQHFDVDVRPDIKFHGVVDDDGKPNFCTLLPNYALGRVDLTLNHLYSGILWTHADSTLDILGFPSIDIQYTQQPAITTMHVHAARIAESHHGLPARSPGGLARRIPRRSCAHAREDGNRTGQV